MTTNNIQQNLFKLLRTRRPHYGAGEAQIAAWIAAKFPITAIDAAGNLHFDLRRNKTNKTLFVAHLDTVHRKDGFNVVKQDGHIWRADGVEVLGADDGAGVAILLHMIENQVPAYFCLTRGEEVGGLGARYLADQQPALLKQFKRAIAFDRKGYDEVITHQAGVRCASDKFAETLSTWLSTEDFSLAFAPSADGVYTDTAEFTEIIPECTNISCGYFLQHTGKEYQDVRFLEQLANRCLTVNWDKLPTKRNPLEYESIYDLPMGDALLGDSYDSYYNMPKDMQKKYLEELIRG